MRGVSEVEAAFNEFYERLRAIKREELNKDDLRRLQRIEDRLIDLVAVMELAKTAADVL